MTAPVEVVVTGTRTPEDSQRATVRTGVVTRKDAERRGATNVGEALEGELGLQVNPQAYGYLGGPSAVQIQGFDEDRVLVLEDGERVIGDVGGAIDLSEIPLADVDRIEYVGGPTSSLYGTSALGGTINVITAPPRDEGPSGRARLEGRSYRGLLAQGSGAYRARATWAAADASYQRSDGVALQADRPDLAVPESERALLGLRIGTSLSRRAELTLRGRFIRSESRGLATQQFPGLGSYLVDLPDTSDRFSLRLSERLRVGERSSLSFSLGAQRFEGRSVKDRRDSPIDEARLRNDRTESFETIATVVSDDGACTWVLGARLERERFDQRLERVTPSRSGLEPVETDEVRPTTLASGALYAQLGWRLGKGVSVMPGVRGEVHRRFGEVLVPRLAAAWAPAEAIRLRVAGGRGFRAPSAKELGFFFDHSILGYRVVGNPDLLPERSWGASGDISILVGPRFRVRVGGFANWVRDLIDTELASTEPSVGVTDYRYVNVGRARTSGADASVKWSLGERFRAELGYAFLWTRNDSSERPLPSRPPHTLQSSILVELPGEFELAARWRAVSSAFVEIGVEAPGYETLDLRVAHRLAATVTVYAGMRNALGVQKDALRAGDERPAFGRIFYLGINAEFPTEV
jgi:outer membrane receptor for ferrienterochelin and colicins